MIVSPRLTAKVLERADARPSFPLAQAVLPTLTLRNWTRRIGRAAAPGRVFVGVLNPGGCFVALMLVTGGETAALAISPLCQSLDQQLRHLAATCAGEFLT
jgi:hypothetical protein